MKYNENPKNGDRLSALGFGCMRFAKNEQETEKQVFSAIEQGVNYFDTAYLYPGNEATLGRILAKGYRDKVRIASKLPPFLVKKDSDLDRILNTQLERLQTDHIDYYLIHMLNDLSDWERLRAIGIEKWIEARKASGQIRNIGFSFHGGYQAFARIIDAFAWEFCMIQFNYLDETNQAGAKGLSYAASKGIPVIVMEPLRGGMLANGLPKEAASIWEKADTRRTPAEWGLRWVWNHPEVMMVLSGMNSQEMINENIRIAEEAEANSLTEQELALFEEVKRVMMGKIKVACTGCNYCMPCPKGVDIPLCFASYNALGFDKRLTNRLHYLMYAGGHQASLCVQCGKCEAHCPQGIAISQNLKAVVKEMEGFPYKPMRFVMNRVMRRR